MASNSTQRSMPTQASPAQARGTRLAVALGDPAGIGAEVVLKALHGWPPEQPPPLLVGCRRWLEQCYADLRPRSTEPLADPGQLELLDLPLPKPVHPGQAGAAGGDTSFHWLTAATELVQTGRCRALVTAPIAKHAWHAAGHPYPGQTERLAELAGVAEAAMLFTARSPHGSWRLNTLLATTHIPLAAVPAALTPKRINAKLDLLLQFCQRFQPRPRLAAASRKRRGYDAGVTR